VVTTLSLNYFFDLWFHYATCCAMPLHSVPRQIFWILNLLPFVFLKSVSKDSTAISRYFDSLLLYPQETCKSSCPFFFIESRFTNYDSSMPNFLSFWLNWPNETFSMADTLFIVNGDSPSYLTSGVQGQVAYFNLKALRVKNSSYIVPCLSTSEADWQHSHSIQSILEC
jgi:hypothetical protein